MANRRTTRPVVRRPPTRFFSYWVPWAIMFVLASITFTLVLELRGLREQINILQGRTIVTNDILLQASRASLEILEEHCSHTIVRKKAQHAGN